MKKPKMTAEEFDLALVEAVRQGRVIRKVDAKGKVLYFAVKN